MRSGKTMSGRMKKCGQKRDRSDQLLCVNHSQYFAGKKLLSFSILLPRCTGSSSWNRIVTDMETTFNRLWHVL